MGLVRRAQCPKSRSRKLADRPATRGGTSADSFRTDGDMTYWWVPASRALDAPTQGTLDATRGCCIKAVAGALWRPWHGGPFLRPGGQAN